VTQNAGPSYATLEEMIRAFFEIAGVFLWPAVFPTFVAADFGMQPI